MKNHLEALESLSWCSTLIQSEKAFAEENGIQAAQLIVFRKSYKLDVPAVKMNNKLLYPVFDLLQSQGIAKKNIKWNDQSRVLTALWGNSTTYTLKLESSVVNKNGKNYKVMNAPLKKDLVAAVQVEINKGQMK